MDVFQCPECDLKFRFASELEQHMALDHPEFESHSKSVEDSLLAAARRRHHAPEPRQDQ
jgi:hypothetical protein